MNFIDEVKVFLKAGNGGDGCSSFRREKFVEFGGPDGGCGGHGGNIVFRVEQNINSLINYRYKPHLKAEHGKAGRGSNRTGESGLDLICYVPIGTQILSEQEEIIYDLAHENEEFICAYGGRGGRGNTTFKSASRQSPMEFTTGQPGEEKTLYLRLKILADVGLVGLPNAGKSTFLSRCSNAKPKIADYPFSTLSPNIGIADVFNTQIVIADIPGIIKGAHKGIGLGHKFLKHIERCNLLLYLIDAASTDDLFATYSLLQNELLLHNRKLEQKEHIVVLTKCDLLSENEKNTKIHHLQNNLNRSIVACGIGYDMSKLLIKVKENLESNGETQGKNQIKYDPLA